MTLPDIRECSWWRPVTVALAGEPFDEAQKRLSDGLLATLEERGHNIIPQPGKFPERVDLLFAFQEIPEGDAPLQERIRERDWPLALDLTKEFGLEKRPENLITFVTIPESLRRVPHLEVIEIARIAMARIGTPRVGFITGDPRSGRIEELTLCTMEGGHPTISGENWPHFLRDLSNRLIALACAQEVGDRYRVVENAIPREDWLSSHAPDELIRAGHRMDQLDLLPPMLDLAQWVSPILARIYERFLNMKHFGEGMLCAWAPRLDLMMVTGSGSWGVDKRHLEREEVVPIGGVSDEDVLVYAPEGMAAKGPSVETREFLEAFLQTPTVKLREMENGWAIDPNGPVEAPMIRSIIHAHVGVVEVDDRFVEWVPPNRKKFPYPFSCGTDLMMDVTLDALSRSSALHDPEDPRAVVLWDFENHGIAVAELWKGKPRKHVVQLTLDMFDPEAVGAIRYTPDRIVQV